MMRRGYGAGSRAAALLAAESNGLAIDFTDLSMVVKDTTTPANNYDGTPGNLLAYSGASPKMTRQSDGVYRYQAHNLLLSSQEIGYNIGWAAQRLTIAANAATAPDGTQTATILTANAGGSWHYTSNVTTIIIGGTYSYSISVKRVNHDWIFLNSPDDAKVTYFNLATGQFGNIASGITASAVGLGDGWYRITLSWTATSAMGGGGLGISGGNAEGSFSAAGTEQVAAWGAYLRRTPSVDTYLPTTSAARYDLPYEWDASGNPLGVLVEPQATNLARTSINLASAYWGAIRSTITANAAVAPDGTTTAATLTATSADGFLYQACESVSGQSHCGTVFIKRKTGSGVVRLIGADGSRSVVSISSSWNRYSVVKTSSTTLPYIGVELATAGDEVHVWQADLVLGVATSPILTYGSQVTRAADDPKIAQTAFPWASGSGTLSVDGVVTTPQTSGGYLRIQPRSGQTHVTTFKWVPA